jgi:hypothetical protein
VTFTLVDLLRKTMRRKSKTAKHKAVYAKRDKAIAQRNGDIQVCSACGGDHWRPDCPKIEAMVHDPTFRARNELEKALAYVRKLGFSPQINGLPFTLSDIYLRPVNGSDKLCCSCCGNPYEAKKAQFRGTLPTPLNWCFSCRELLRERQRSIGDVLALHDADRKRKGKLIRASEQRVRDWVLENQKRK